MLNVIYTLNMINLSHCLNSFLFKAMLHHRNDELIILKQEKAELALLSDQ